MSTAIEPARSLAKFTTFDRNAGLLYWRAARREDTMRPTSIAIAAAITANSHQLVCTTCGFVSKSRRIASLVTSVAAAAMITDSPSAARFSARRWP